MQTNVALPASAGQSEFCDSSLLSDRFVFGRGRCDALPSHVCQSEPQQPSPAVGTCADPYTCDVRNRRVDPKTVVDCLRFADPRDRDSCAHVANRSSTLSPFHVVNGKVKHLIAHASVQPRTGTRARSQRHLLTKPAYMMVPGRFWGPASASRKPLHVSAPVKHPGTDRQPDKEPCTNCDDR